jgi:hypothetical protein
MRLCPITATAAVAALLVLSGCTSGAPAAPTGAPTTSATSTATPTSAAPAGGPVITSFQLIDDVTCSGSEASVPVSWGTRGAQTVIFEIDGKGDATGDRALSGTGNVNVPCDGREHQVVLVAEGSGERVSLSRHVNTANTPPQTLAPVIARFDILEEVTCTGPTVEVAASWTTQNAQGVGFSVDGQPLPAAAGFPATGTGNIPVPCDGAAHKVTLTATGTGPSASLSRSVNTSTSSGSTTGSPTATTTATSTATSTATTSGSTTEPTSTPSTTPTSATPTG